MMSCYNASQYLSEAIESILQQTYSDYEFLLINDGSTDGTLDILRTYASEDKRIVVVDKKNTGLADSLNVGLKAARGKWIARLDADDIALPERLAQQMAFVHWDPSVILLGTACVLIDQSGGAIGRYRYPAGHHSLVTQMEKHGSPFPHSSVLFHKETVIRIGGYNGRFVPFCEDVDLWLRLSRIGVIACLPQVLVKIRKHGSNITSRSSMASRTVMATAVNVCHFLRAKGVIDPSQKHAGTWKEFLTWLTQRLDHESYLESCCQWSRMTQDFSLSVASGRRLCASLQLVGGLLRSGCACDIIARRLFGSNLPAQLADEWIQAHVDCRQGV